MTEKATLSRNSGRGGEMRSAAGTLVHQLQQQSAPLLPEEVGPRQAAVSSDHAQVGDAAQHQVVRCLQASLVGAELFAAGAANHCPTLAMTRAVKKKRCPQGVFFIACVFIISRTLHRRKHKAAAADLCVQCKCLSPTYNGLFIFQRFMFFKQ